MAESFDLPRRARALAEQLAERETDKWPEWYIARVTLWIAEFGESCYAEGRAARQGEVDAAKAEADQSHALANHNFSVACEHEAKWRRLQTEAPPDPALPALTEQALMDTAKQVVQGFRVKVAAGEITELAAVNAAMGITDFIHALLGGSATTETR